MTHLILPHMNGKGLILNVGSFTGDIPTGLLSVYGATKAFLKSFSHALYIEQKSHGIHVQYLNTAFVVTGMSKIKKSTWLVPNPKEYVSFALKNIGSSSCTPYPSHAFMEAFLFFLPMPFKMNYFYSTMKNLKSKALRKQNKHV